MIFRRVDWRIEARQRAQARMAQLKLWAPWFAWRPVRVSPDRCVWLEQIERAYPHAYVAEAPGEIIALRGEPVYRLPSI